MTTQYEMEDMTKRPPFGRLTVIAFAGKRGRNRLMWECRCECGKTKVVNRDNLVYGHTTSCGCRKLELLEARSVTHGASRDGRWTPEYRAYRGILTRCFDGGTPYFSNYGGRGITVCDRWRSDYSAFLSDMGQRPSPKHSIDRIDNDGNYEPGNCRWATRAEQNRNKRGVHTVEWDGKTRAVCDVARELGIKPRTVTARIRRGKTALEALRA